MTTQPTRRPRPAKSDEPPRAPLAPAFDRDAVALAYLHERGHLTESEFRANLRRLGVELEQREPRKLPVPTVVRLEAPTPPEPVVAETEDEDEAPVDEDRWFDQFADETEG